MVGNFGVDRDAGRTKMKVLSTARIRQLQKILQALCPAAPVWAFGPQGPRQVHLSKSPARYVGGVSSLRHRSPLTLPIGGTIYPMVPIYKSIDATFRLFRMCMCLHILKQIKSCKVLKLVPDRKTPYSAWHGHIPFGMVLVELLQPRVIVELGTHYGDSYCAFCQAVKFLKLNCRCYAIDTWEGDEFTGPYTEVVYKQLRQYHDPRYGTFSQLIKSTFDDALDRFENKSIDLLHIDGSHRFESVKHDFESWLPKLSDTAVVLLHDTCVYEDRFGVHKLWAELEKRYPSFNFTHCYGLGVLGAGREQLKLSWLFEAGPKERNEIQSFFAKRAAQNESKIRTSFRRLINTLCVRG